MPIPDTPYTRKEAYLNAIATGDSGGIPETPYTRKEAYLNAIATGDSGGIPETPFTREEMYLDAIARNGGGGGGGSGGDITVESKSISSNGTYTAPSGKAYSPVTVNVPNSYAAGDEGKVVSNGALVSQTAHAEVTSNGTIDTTLNNSVVVNVQGSGGYGYTKLAEADFTVNTTSTSEINVGAIECPGIDLSKMIFVTVRDKAGKRNGYLYGTDSIVYNSSARRHESQYVFGSSQLTQYTSNGYGVYPNNVINNGSVDIKAKYHSSFTGTIDGTYHVEVYTLDWPDGVSPFAT